MNSAGHKLELINYRNCHDVDVLVDDKYIRKHAEYSNFKNGSIKSPFQPTVCGVGYFGEGEYSSRNDDGSINEVYQSWKDMIKRCYDNKSIMKRPLYQVVTVCDEWKNYQNFAKWYCENRIYIDEEINVDKDIIGGDRKIYSPETCCIIPKTINIILQRQRKINKGKQVLPMGVIKYGNKFFAQLSKNGRRIHKYGFNTSEEAFAWYKQEKEKYIKEVTNKYKDILPKRTYDALMNYEIKPYPFTEEELAL